jgi:hypothetical protein
MACSSSLAAAFRTQSGRRWACCCCVGCCMGCQALLARCTCAQSQRSRHCGHDQRFRQSGPARNSNCHWHQRAPPGHPPPTPTPPSCATARLLPYCLLLQVQPEQETARSPRPPSPRPPSHLALSCLLRSLDARLRVPISPAQVRPAQPCTRATHLPHLALPPPAPSSLLPCSGPSQGSMWWIWAMAAV